MANEQNAPARFGSSDLAVDPSRGIPLYVQLANILRYKILSGAWPVGLRLDKFETLAAQFQVARITVRQAVALLVKEGLLSARRGRGTIVCGGAGPDSAPERAGSIERFARERDIQIKILYKGKVTTLPAEFAGDFELFDDSYVEVSKVHTMRGVTVGMMRIFVAEEVFQRFPRRAMEKSTLLRLVFEYAPERSEQVHQVLTVEPADFILSENLSYPLGSPIAKILRHSYGADRRLAYAGISWYRGESFEMDMT
ncbi:MAG: GntR family transcriptional regulator, partial [Terriglobales bacterium]